VARDRLLVNNAALHAKAWRGGIPLRNEGGSESMKTPMVSVVMSVFNGERFLPEAIESILGQTFRDFEFIIIDDGSMDGSAAILDSYREGDTRIRVYHEKHAGLVKSLNRGCGLALGKYLGRMDADDVASPDRLALQVDFMESHAKVGVVGGTVEWIDTTGKSLGIYPYPADDREIKAGLLYDCVLWHPTVLLRKEVFARAGGYRDGVFGAEDYDLWLRIADHFQLANIQAVVLKYRIHPYQVSMQKRVQQTLGTLASQIAAKRRKHGLLDPLDDVEEITPDALEAWGIPIAEQRSRLMSDWRRWIRLMYMAGEYSTALSAATEVLQTGNEDVERWQVADLHWIVAQLFWREGRTLRSAASVGRALFIRPLVAGYLLRQLFQAAFHDGKEGT
jgi:Glycosyl transferase family 2